MSNNTFTAQGSTFVRVVTAASTVLTPTLTTIPAAIAPQIAALDYRFTNVGTQAIFIAYSAASAAAPTAAVPADGATGAVITMEPNSTHTIAFAYGTQLAVIAAATGSTVYVCIGAGNSS